MMEIISRQNNSLINNLDNLKLVFTAFSADQNNPNAENVEEDGACCKGRQNQNSDISPDSGDAATTWNMQRG